MANVFLYGHGGSGNHGCEAIVRATAQILAGHSLHLITASPEEDSRYGLEESVSLIRETTGSIHRFSLGFLKAYAALKLRRDFIPMEKLRYREAFDKIGRGDIALSIGGDNYCYADAYKYTMFHQMAKKRGARTVLWGCSVEPAVARKPEIAADLAQYDLITARETISYEALKKINPNTVLVADPAFVLEPAQTQLPEGFVPGNTVGINLSPMAMDCESVPGIAFENYKNLMADIIDRTDMQIALIPHVVWEQGDDRLPLRRLYDAFAHTGRVVMVEDRNCRELKDIISHCRFFIGARTHSTIAAYSSGVPTLVLGYSVKSRGIARDLFGHEEGYVLPVQQMQHAEELVQGFAWLQNKENEVRDRLSDLSEYKQKSAAAVL